MKIKQIKNILLSIGLIGSLSIVGAVFSQGTNTASALCPENAGTTDQCYYDNYNNIQNKGGTTKAQYDEWVQNCRGKGGGLFGGGADEGSCSNAVAGCINAAVNRSDCGNGDTMASLAGCQTGDVTKQNCLQIINLDDFSKVNDDTKKETVDTCTLRAGNEAQDRKDCEKAYEDAHTKCQAQRNQKGSSTSGYDRYNKTAYDEYSSCMNNEMLKSSKDPAECKARGGEMIATPGQQNNDMGTCVAKPQNNEDDPQDLVCDDGQAPKEDGTCADGSKPKAQSGSDDTGKTCGDAETVLISCEGTGVGAIGDVLRIAIYVLTALIGVAAVGGLAWASILYAKAEDNQGNVTEARALIRNIVIGILLYGFLIAIVNWLVPGGVIG